MNEHMLMAAFHIIWNLLQLFGGLRPYLIQPRRTRPGLMLSFILLLILVLTLAGKDLLVAASPMLAETQVCNPNTVQHGCDCQDDWWEPVVWECYPCSNICKYGAIRTRCLKDCPVYAEKFFTSSTPTSTTIKTSKFPRTLLSSTVAPLTKMYHMVTGKSIQPTESSAMPTLLIVIAVLGGALFCAVIIGCFILRRNNFRPRWNGMGCGFCNFFHSYKLPVPVEDPALGRSEIVPSSSRGMPLANPQGQDEDQGHCPVERVIPTEEMGSGDEEEMVPKRAC